jgi:hypothetical protein
MSLIDLVQPQLGPNGVQEISQQLGTDPSSTQRAIDAALPMMVGGMAHAAQQPGGDTAVQAALGAHGEHHDTVQDGVAQESGLDKGKVVQLLILLAPIVLRALSQHKAASHPGGLAAGLQEEAERARVNAPSPQVGGVLGQILGRLGG